MRSCCYGMSRLESGHSRLHGSSSMMDGCVIPQTKGYLGYLGYSRHLHYLGIQYPPLSMILDSGELADSFLPRALKL